MQTQTDKTNEWPIDIGAVPETQTKLMGKWQIDIGATPKTQTQTNKMNDDRLI